VSWITGVRPARLIQPTPVSMRVAAVPDQQRTRNKQARTGLEIRRLGPNFERPFGNQNQQ
jgi:hypothetical protein